MRRAGVLVVAVALLLVGSGMRLAYIEIQQGPALRERAGRQQRSTRVIPARRGEILDALGRVLAGTVRRPSVFVDPMLVDDVSFAAYSLAPVLDLKPAALERDLHAARAEHKRFLWLKRRISEEDKEAFQSVARGRRLRAFDVQYEAVRDYPQGRLAAHVLGFVGVDLRQVEDGPAFEDLHGLAGLEAQYDDLLAGTPGEQTLTVDVVRRPVRTSPEGYRPAVDGATLVLTIDAYIQQVAQRALAAAVQKYAAHWGAAVVMDPQTGEVLAMAVCPDFEPANAIPPDYSSLSPAKQEEIQGLWRNRAVTDSFEPGSVFKPFIASQALEEGLLRLDEVFVINGPVHDFGRRTIKDTHAYGSLALHEVISKSSNIGMGLVGARCGMERLYRYVRTMGFGDVTGVGLPGEHDGLVQDFSRWNPSYSPQSIPIGQEIAVTPIQIATAFSVFCNGGVLLRPRIVRGVIGPDGVTQADYSRPVAVRRVLSERTTQEFRMQALVETVVSGTGKPAALPDYQVFGKTGTAQVAIPGQRGYLSAAYVGSFVGGAPADQPRAVALVSIYRPTKDGYYGGVVAAPAVKEILGYTLAYLHAPPDLDPRQQPSRATGGPVDYD